MRPLPPDCVDLLERQHGVLARWQAPATGLDRSSIDTMLRADRWRPLYRGVYAAFTGVPSRQSMLWAAVCRCGPAAALSYHSAAELDRLADRAGTEIHVTIPAQARCVIADSELAGTLPPIVVHRSARIGTARHPLRLPPRTRIEETALDLTQLAATVEDAAAWIARACGRRLTRPDRLRAAMQERGRLRWRAELSAMLDDVGTGAYSALELRYVRDVERPHGLPTATRQVRFTAGARTSYVDNLYADFGVAVELDGLATHLPETRWRDIRRDNSLSRAGLVTVRYSWSDVTRQPCRTAREIADVLRAHGWPGRASQCPLCPVVR